MRLSTLLSRNLTYFWRSNLAVVLGVATAVAVLAGALLVGDSVRGSLRDLFVQRLGKTDEVIASTTFFKEKVVDDIQADSRFSEAFSGACPLMLLNALVIDEQSGRRASGVQVYGVDDRFWKFHGRAGEVRAPNEREALLSPDLARELGSQPGHATLLRIEKPSAIPAGSLHGRKDDLGRTIRLDFRETLAASKLGEFSLRPSQGAVRAIFVSLPRLQKDLEQPEKVNNILVADKSPGKDLTMAGPPVIAGILKDNLSLEDLGVKLRVLDSQRGIALESQTAMISDQLYAHAVDASAKFGMTVVPILSYLANGIRLDQREVPYSVVTAIDDEQFKTLCQRYRGGPVNSTTAVEMSSLPRIALNDWAAIDLGAKRGDEITLDYYLWEEEGRLRTESARFMVDAILPLNEAIDRDLVPDYPGLTETENIADWDPPFPVDLKRVRPKDEDYWHKYRTTPKAFISLDEGAKLWQSRHGKFTSLRIRPLDGSDPQSRLETFKQSLRAVLDPIEMGFSISSVRTEGLEASQGATDFGEYFVYFSFFLVIGALLLASLFFKLGIEQRLREIGTLRAVGFSGSVVRSLFLKEGLVLAAAGSVLGVIGAVGYGALIMYGLRTWWVGSVGTTELRLHVSALSLLLGGAGGIVAALLCVIWTLRTLKHSSPRSLLTGSLDAALQANPPSSPPPSAVLSRLLPVVFATAGVLLLVAASLERVGKTAGFFGAGALLLVALLCFEYGWLKGKTRSLIRGSGWWPVSRLGFRNATYRPGRSILCIALIASAAFIIVAVDAFKRDSGGATLDKKSGNGGFPLQAESLLPIYHDPNTNEGKEALNIVAQKGFDPESVTFTGFRVRPGDDASCLNLYQPRNPRILGVADRFIVSGRFSFQESLAQTREQKENPWLLLNQEMSDGSIPVLADANSMTYVLHRKLGDEIVISRSNGESARLRLVGALADSIFQSELLMSDTNFLKLFPEQGGYGFFLLELPPEAASVTTAALEEQLSDFGFDVTSTTERLASFHRVENTYLSTFQTLGGLGLVLGTLGLATILLRNVLERRRELALLRAIGYNAGHFALMVITENAFLVCCGLVTGAVCALLAIGPVFFSRGGHFPALSMSLLLSVFVTGLFASLAATIAALRTPLLPALRSE
ncbi:MAG TPA: ABC transporter permease [Blastocatellia bacterium]|nr:ABC transporter permease [Blastocatellia bacterium]